MRGLDAGLAATLGLVALFGACREREAIVDAPAGPASSSPTAARILYPSAPASFVELVASARHGIVGIRSATPVKSGPAAMFPGAPDSAADVSLGTGFLIEARGVYVLTNDHLAAAASELRVVLPDGSEVPAKVLGRDVRLDLALLSIDAPRLRPLQLGDSDELRVGEWIVVLGDPFGDEVSASAGIVSATGREAAGSLVQGRAMGHRTYLQTDARIHRGNTGGPVLDTAGQVVGVAVASSDRPGELSFAIPINRVKEIVDALRDYGQVSRGWLGVLVKPVTPELAQSLSLPKTAGALVTEVKAGSPAARSALRSGDVILKWGDREIDHRSLPWIVAGTPVGRPTEVVVWRNHAELKISVVTDKMPE
ncbi:MAG: peptidase and chymotrypsin/Hap [Deltaproteobacteria bacterium]|nr:peptidase and chymotrypsin/Hap [Deltaproteobacteria bacterium]